jgi:hypothetical protein
LILGIVDEEGVWVDMVLMTKIGMVMYFYRSLCALSPVFRGVLCGDVF